tara:strand:- start:35 stop:226 length:192 start_codon:yes stop_codon:yes gene_type:complete
MAMTRTERRNAHKKQERLQVGSEAPRVEELIDGVPVIRFTALDGLVQYISFKGVLYKSVFTRV